MKELSIEEKAHNYDEVREKIAIRFGSNVADEIFSQFEMSEDERIRKEIINYLEPQGDCCGNKERWIAWLEKQGKNMGISEATKQKLEDNLKEALEKETSESCNEFLDEQKPIDKVEPKFKVGDKVYALRNRFECIIESMDETTYYGDTTNFDIKDQDDWKLVEQKSSWSEEDERNASYICAALDCYYRLREDRCNTNGQENLDKARNWLCNKLKSLSPQKQWKPSDEQIYALRSVVTELKHGDNKYQETIEDLYQDLLKLREEYIMKANEAPEKIILSADRETEILYNEWVVKDLTDNIKIEYTRTNAFIEKACDFISGLRRLDDGVIEDFKNYMKGE